MTLAAASSVDPGVGMVIWIVVVSLSIPAAAVTAAKGRWGWFAFGFLTYGITWLLGAFQPAAPTSFWSRRVRRGSTSVT